MVLIFSAFIQRVDSLSYDEDEGYTHSFKLLHVKTEKELNDRHRKTTTMD